MTSALALVGLVIPEHLGAELRSGVRLHPRQDVLVHGHRECRACVTEPFADDLHGDAGLQQDRRMGVPQEVADLALYLCSDEASFITGTDFPIDGGFIKLNG